MARLSWTNDHGEQEHTLAAAARIGRAEANDIQLLDPAVSLFHARVIPEGENWVLVDSNSTNGCFVNGQPCKWQVLRDGDIVAIGDFELMFHQEEATHANLPGDTEDTAPDLDGIIWDRPASISTVSSVQLPTIGSTAAGTNREALERRLKACFEISKATAATLAVTEVLGHIVEALFGIFESADRAIIFLLDAGSREVRAAASKVRTPDDSKRIEISHTALDQAISRREAVLCLDALDDKRYSMAQSVVNLGIRSMMIAPLVFQDEVLGAIYVDTRRAAAQFVKADLDLLSAAAVQAAGCVANAQLHEKVVHSERLAAVGQTVAGMAHCVKNVLQTVKGGRFIVDRGFEQDDPGMLRRGWDLVSRGTTHLEELVLDLLSYSKERKPSCEPTDLNSFCAELRDLCAARAEAQGVTVDFQPEPSLPTVDIDPMGIRRCLLNLLMNAVDACAEKKGTVAMRTHAADEDGFVRISVADDGCGMSEETKARLFTMFFSTKGGKGTGLGLPVVQKVAREHGGRVEVESQEGQGTTFTVFLPQERPEAKSDTDISES